MRRKSILIIGGTSDIGIAIAARFAGARFAIWLAGRDLNYLDRVARDIQIRNSTEVNCSAFDAQDFSSHSDFYASIPIRIDVCVCVFGYLGDQYQAERDWSEAHKIVDSNYTGAVSILNIVARDFAERKRGTIIGISSVAGDRGRQSNFIYGSAKAGFTAYLSGLRNKLLKYGVRVVTVKPGFVSTRMTEGIPLPPLLTVSPQFVAEKVFKSYHERRDVIYVLWLWRWIMAAINTIPEFLFKRLNL